MTDAYRDLHNDAHKNWRDDRADGFAEIQRRAFLAGFEAAADESETFSLLRRWLEEQRDEAKQRHADSDDGDRMAHTRASCFSEVLVKLHEMGCEPADD